MLIKELINTLEVKRVIEEIAAYRGWPIALFGASGSSRAAYISAIATAAKKKVVVITKDERSASRLKDDLSFFMQGVDHFPRRDLTLRPV